jgi:hypothetical protein
MKQKSVCTTSILSNIIQKSRGDPCGRPPRPPLSLTHFRARQARTYPYDDDGAAAPAARSHCKGRGGGGVVRGPLWLPWGGVGPLAGEGRRKADAGDDLWLPWGGVGPRTPVS